MLKSFSSWQGPEARMNIEDYIKRLDRLDACAISDALDALNEKGSISGLHRRSTTRRIAGRVQTVKLMEGPPPENSVVRHLGTAAIDAANDSTVIVVQQNTGVDCAGWGGVLANAASAKGVRGVIVEGPARDIDECEQIGFPVFSRSVTARTARNRVHEESFATPIQVAGITVEPGDYVVADGSGVVFISARKIEMVLSIAENIASKEKAMTREVISGKLVSEVMGNNYERMLSSKSKK